jgi:hypothetical protein
MRADALSIGLLLAAVSSAAAAADDPEADLLMYIGGMVEVNDTWIGPDDMQAVSEPPVEVTRRDDATKTEMPE